MNERLIKRFVPVILFMTALQGWTLSIPLFGSILGPSAASAGVDPAEAATVFLSGYALSFAGWGVLLHRRRRTIGQLLPALTSGCLVLCAALSLSLLVLDGFAWPAVFGAMGLFASLPSLSWLYMLTRCVPFAQIGLALGVNGMLVSFVRYFFHIISDRIPPQAGIAIVSALPLVAVYILLRIRQELAGEHAGWDADRDSRQQPGHFGVNPVPVIVFIFVIFLLGGIMYQVVEPFMQEFGSHTIYYQSIPYVLAIPLAGWIIDRRGFRLAMALGVVLLGLAYTTFAFSTSFPAAVAGNTLIQIGFAVLDVFVLYALAAVSSPDRRFLVTGIGLGFYILSIRLGTELNALVVPYSNGNYIVVYLTALFILLISVLLIHWVSDFEPREIEKRQRLEKLGTYYEEKDAELREARQVQAGMLRAQWRLPPGIEAAVMTESAKEVGGDFYDLIPLEGRRALFAVGDVTGKGLAAALVMSKMIGLLRSEAYYGHSLTEIVEHMNRMLLREPEEMAMVTLGLALVDRESSSVTYVSAGHVAPYIVRGGLAEALDTHSLPLGIDEVLRPWSGKVVMEPGDLFVMYTDGVLDLENGGGERFGLDRFEQLLSEAGEGGDPELALKRIVDAFNRFGAVTDDTTLLLIRMNGKSAGTDGG
ncbi:MFS transporter [Paenibacillus sp. GCM10012303]|uniref:MFS transporter n=1 Tax=Paenibacillus sp. GCM10012303 TaxID=3317340 RepID=UPI00361B1486